jgi:tetratricopeptide (TPR) repeat protein
VQPYWMSLLAQAYLRGGQVEDGLRILRRALAVTRDQHVWKAELHRLYGEFLLASSHAHDYADADQSITRAEDCFRRAIRTARRQQSKSLELRAGTSLARSWTSRGNRKEARDLLGPIYNWFTEGFGTPDMEDARVLLGALR